MLPIRKYPRTRHLEGSGLQADDDPLTVPWRELVGRHLVVEEKLDGANCGLSFGASRQLLLQSRGHYLTGPRERQFALLKSWAQAHTAQLWNVLGDRYTLYGEWCYAKHTIFYTDLPHYFMAFDILDTATDTFLATEQRDALLRTATFIASVPVLHTGELPSLAALQQLIGPSNAIASDHQAQLRAAAVAAGRDPAQALAESDNSSLMEGLYIKVERDGAVVDRHKYVRPSFIQTVVDLGSHWQDRPLLPNRLRAGVRLW